MNVLRHKWIAVLAIAVVAAGVLWLWQRSREPRYKGKTIRQWIETARPTKTFHTNYQVVSMTKEYNHKALERMLDAMGSNAAPVLMQILDEGDSAMTKFKAAMTRSKWVPASVKSMTSAGLDHSHETLSIASHALGYLGSNAIHTVPDLERITCDPKSMTASYFAAHALGGFGFRALPALRRSLTNAPSARRQIVSAVMQNIYRTALQSSDARDREEAALGLSEYPRPPFEIIFVLLDILKSPDRERQKQSLEALAVHLPTMAPSLIVAREAVTNAAASADPDQRRLAIHILAELKHFDSKQKP